MVRLRLVPCLLAAACLHAVVAELVFQFHFSANSIRLWPDTPMACGAMLAPYALFYFAHRIARTPFSRRCVALLAAASAVSGGVLYAGAFVPHEHADMFGVMFFVLPMVQGLVAMLTLAMVGAASR